ncbi:MAG: N-acetylmuramoyl-L-alanine amidase [Acidobacteria bacterium]|nr:N-acetylmuramoyl-L-alanine amidase [Acidobacteriota bacterium]
MKKISTLAFLVLFFPSCFAPSNAIPANQAGTSPTPTAAPKQTAKAPAPTATPVVCLDPGHPSETSAGNVVQNGTTEVHIVWLVGLKLKALLEAQGIKVVMTKNREDEVVTNKERAMIANRAQAKLMIRLHCDASSDNGYAVYSPDRPGTVQNTTGPTQDLIERSKVAANLVHQGMAAALEGVLKDGGVRGDSKTFIGAKQGALTGSIFSQVPAVLIEMVVLSNPQDAEFIKSEAGQMKMAGAIAQGITLYLKP